MEIEISNVTLRRVGGDVAVSEVSIVLLQRESAEKGLFTTYINAYLKEKKKDMFKCTDL